MAEAILGWPNEFLRRVGPDLRAVRTGRPVEPGAREGLREFGLLGPDGKLTVTGRRLAYNFLEDEWQAADPQLKDFLDLAGLGPGAKVLDIGCASGQTLRVLDACTPTQRVGIDVELDSLALGHRRALLDGQDICFIRASGHALPFRDGAFSHVISRGALNYMHQRSGLEEVVRVLRPGGFLLLRYEALRHDLMKLLYARGLRERLCRVRDLGVGLVLALTGRQQEPWRLLGGGRTFVSSRRLSRFLDRAGIETLRVEAGTGCPVFLGSPTQTSLLARRRP